MSTKGVRNFRPKLHFSPEKNWNNDPNGLVYIDGIYHLYYQYYPEKPIWGPMHWGHAISTDLIHWEHKPIALYPDELGFIFSGSAIYDINNTSGLGTIDNPPLIAIYTSHGDNEQQSIAYSLDKGLTFTKYDKNPVIKNTEIADFRDPKVFWNNIKNCWSLVLAAKDRVHFYSSSNLKEWEKTGEFGPEFNFCVGCWECPDLIPFETEEGTKWVLLVSMGMGSEYKGARTQYFVGNFDGETFIADKNFTKTEFIDSGLDNYAGVTYSNTEDKIFIGWGINPQYAGLTPTDEFCGIMTLPKKLSLLKTNDYGYRLSMCPTGLVFNESKSEKISSGYSLQSESFWLQIKGKNSCKIKFTNKENQELIFGLDENDNLYLDRSNGGASSFSEDFASELFNNCKINRLVNGDYCIDAIFDVSVFELYIDKGLRVMSNVVYPDSSYNKLEYTGDISVSILNL